MTVTDSWQTITGWLGERLPAAIADLNPPASEADLRSVETAVGLDLPADLRTWLRLNDGMSAGGSFGRLLPPVHNPISCRRILTEYRTWLSISDPDELANVADAPAGTPASEYAPAFVPFADDGAGTSLFVDLREGDLNGCVGEWNPEMGGFDGPLWPGVAAMLADVATALTTESSVLGSDDDAPGPWAFELADGKWLHWI